MKAKKSYGQHFLIRDDVAEKIVDAIPESDAKYILEVGPGQGKLTQFLLKRDEELFCVEADRDMVLYLRKHYPELHDYIIPIDYLKLNPRIFFGEDKYMLTGNYPYNISSQILFRMLQERDYIPHMVGMFQKEVAARIIAKPGNKTYGVLSVLTQAFYEGNMVMTLKPGNFSPPPKVNSAVIHLSKKPEEEWIKSPYDDFRKVVKTAFGQRRKMLRNSLSPFFEKDYMMSHDIFRRRPEKLSVEEFDELTLDAMK